MAELRPIRDPLARVTARFKGFVLETEWRGITFRSRLEARWAVFYDMAGIPYEYEPEGFEFTAEGLRYLPDFWLPDQDVFAETKGEYPNDDEWTKAEKLADATDKDVFVFYGSIPTDLFTAPGAIFFSPQWDGDGDTVERVVGIDEGYVWCECRHCQALGIEFGGRAERLPCHYEPDSPRDVRYETPRLLTAYNTARAERFGH